MMSSLELSLVLLVMVAVVGHLVKLRLEGPKVPRRRKPLMGSWRGGTHLLDYWTAPTHPHHGPDHHGADCDHGGGCDGGDSD